MILIFLYKHWNHQTKHRPRYDNYIINDVYFWMDIPLKEHLKSEYTLNTIQSQSSLAAEVLASWLPRLITDCLTAWRVNSALQRAHCAHFEAVPAGDAIRGSAELGPKGSEFMRWLRGTAGNRHRPGSMCGLIRAPSLLLRVMETIRLHHVSQAGTVLAVMKEE